uniref:Uncharacterized protein n=1 Tax=Anguilla anguilla TaxID=7936 RepID=A0A0E9WLN8_ANGAN
MSCFKHAHIRKRSRTRANTLIYVDVCTLRCTSRVRYTCLSVCLCC